MMEAFGLGPLPPFWECKIHPQIGRVYFICHQTKQTTWDDPRLIGYPTPAYHIAITQPTAYFEDSGGSSRWWSSPIPSLKGFSLHRRGSSPRLGGSPRVAPSPTLPPRNKRNEPSIVLLESSSVTGYSTDQRGGGATSSQSQYSHHNELSTRSPVPSRAPTATSHISVSLGTSRVSEIPETPAHTNERPPSAHSFSSSSYCGVPASFLASCDVETAFRTICCLFPTAGETEVRNLFHKYHNRANLVLSALQVAKHPLASEMSNQLDLAAGQKLGVDGKDGDTDTIITSILGDSKSVGMHSPLKVNSNYGTDSPARTGTPVSLMKFSNNQSSAGSLFTRYGSPQLSMSPQLNLVRSEGSGSGRLSKSPKMKLKYLKGVFPAADETFLLDVLSSCDNNVQKASDKLLRKGFSRTPPPKPARHKWFEVKNMIEKRQRAINNTTLANAYHQAMGEPLETPFSTPLPRPARPHMTAVEKARNKEELARKFPNLPERFIFWALEASEFEKSKAEILLQEVGPQTPEEFKPFLVEGAKPGTEEKKWRKAEKEAPGEGRKISFADTVVEVIENDLANLSLSSKSQSPASESNKIGLSSDENVDTPDSGYFELESKNKKKNFITNLFNLKDKDSKAHTGTSHFAKGPNPSLAKGPNPEYIKSHHIQTIGRTTTHQPKGPNPNLAKGPKQNVHGPSLAKGPVWSKVKNSVKSSNILNNNNNPTQFHHASALETTSY